MTISNTSRTAGPFLGNGATKIFPFTFKVFARSDLLVAITNTATSVETILTLDADYTVSLNADQNANPGGTITTAVAPAAGFSLAATSNIALSQTLDLTNQGGFYPRAITDALDKITIQIQQLATKVGVGLNVGASATLAAILATVSNLASGTGSTLVGWLQQGVGAVIRTVSSKLFERVSVLDFGADPTGGTDSTAAILAAINAVDLAGGGVVNFPPGTYATSSGLTLGNGSNSAMSTKHNRITLRGAGYGTSAGVSGQQINGATRILYNGATSGSTAVVNLAGPLHSVNIEDMMLDCNSLAGIGLTVNHCTQATFRRVAVRNYTSIGCNLTTRSGFPSGCAFGNADNRFYDCYALLDNAGLVGSDIIGILMTSGVSTAVSLVGKPDTARCVFIGGTFMYGTTAASYGVMFNGADNNTMIEPQFFPINGTTAGYDIWYQQWAGSGNFPLENFIANPGMTRGAGGNGGVGSGYGNTISPYCTSDGAVFPPAVTGLSGKDHLGREFVNGLRKYSGRQLDEVFSQTPQTTSSTSFSNVNGYSITLTVNTGYLEIDFAGAAAKATAGEGKFMIAVAASGGGTIAYGESESRVGATGYYGGVACKKLVQVNANTYTITVQFASSDANAVTLKNGTLRVRELY